MQGMGKEAYKSLTKTDGEDKGECPRLTIPQGPADFSKIVLLPVLEQQPRWREEGRQKEQEDGFNTA